MDKNKTYAEEVASGKPLESRLRPKIGDKVIVVRIGRKSSLEFPNARVCALFDPYATCWIQPGIKFLDKKVEFGILMYDSSPNKIIYVPETALAFPDKSVTVVAVPDMSAARSEHHFREVEQGDSISGIFYKEFTKYLAKAGIVNHYQTPAPKN